jgi:hypothetical protein
VDNEGEIYGQRLNAANGVELGSAFRLSDMGPNNNPAYAAYYPALAYNAAADEYLVTWSGDDNTGTLVDGEFEIFAQRLAGPTGAELGVNDRRLSDMGPDGSGGFAASLPAVTANGAGSRFLVTWTADDNTGGQVNDENEIFAQTLEAASGLELGPDVRLTYAGGDTRFDVLAADVAYNSLNHEYFVVWAADDLAAGLVEGEFEIFAQRVDAATGDRLGPRLRLSDIATEGNPNYDGYDPAVAYNSRDNQYLVVWSGESTLPGMADNELEIFGQLVDAVTGAELGPDLRLSDMGPDGNASYGAHLPAVAYNNADNQYLVVWSGEDNTGSLVLQEFEIFAQRLSAAGLELGGDQRLSHMGPDGDTGFGATAPALAYNSADDQYLVVWHGTDDAGDLAQYEAEVYGQRLDAATGLELGADDFRLSDMGPDGDPTYGARNPAVAYNSAENEYLVVWHGTDNTGSLVAGESEIFGQRLDAPDGLELGPNDFRLSHMGPDGTAGFSALYPAIVYNPAAGEYLVVWSGDHDAAPLANDENEISAQSLAGVLAAPRGAQFRVSFMGPDGDPEFAGFGPTLAAAAAGEYLAVWVGDHHASGLIDQEYEAFGQRLRALYPLHLPLISR